VHYDARSVYDPDESSAGEETGGRLDNGLLRDLRFFARGDSVPQVVDRLANGGRCPSLTVEAYQTQS
jgi:hypothetical protein